MIDRVASCVVGSAVTDGNDAVGSCPPAVAVGECLLGGATMAETINWSVTFDAVLGPSIAASGTQTLSAYDKISIPLDAAAADIDVDVQPSATAGDVQLLVITSSSYEAEVTFSADAGTTEFTLDGPVVLIGAGGVGLLGAPPQTLRFANPDTEPVGIDILVGRQA
jgi:hypothetical protein